MSHFDSYDDRYGGNGAYGDMHNSYENAKANSINTLASLGAVQEKNGEYTWMGIKLDRDLAFLAQQATSGLPTLIGEKLSTGVYENASKVFNKLHEKLGKPTPHPLQSHKFGIYSAAAATSLLIGLQPIVTIGQSFKDRNEKRSEVRKDLKAVIEADKTYKDNEVVKTAFEQTQKIVTAGLKNAAGQLPTVFTNGIFAWGNHKILAKEKRSIAEGIPLPPDAPREFNVDEKTQQFIGLGALAGNIALQRKIFKDNDADFSKPTAYSMIMELKRNIDAGYGGRSDIANQVIQIFQQNEVDRGRIAFGDKLLPKLAPLTERIGEVIASGELDPISLVNLVGKGDVIKKDNNGNRRFITSEQLEIAIDEQRKNFGNREKTSLEELLANFQNPKIVGQAIKDNLRNLQGDDRAIFAALLSDDVLLKSGVKRKELPDLRARGCDVTCEFIKSVAVELAQKSPEELKAKGLSEKEIEAVSSFKELVYSGDKKAVISAIRSTGEDGTNQIKSAVLTSGLNDKNFSWSAAIKSTKKDITKKEPATSMVEAVSNSKQNGNGVSLNA
jgi:hypothetical protein